MVKPRCSRAVPTIVGMFALLGLMFVGVTGCGDDHSSHDHGDPDIDTSAPATGTVEPAPKPYPLDYCVVSDEKLDSMGKPKVIVHEGQEIKFCCGGCEKKFLKDPAKFLKLIADAKK